MEPGIEESVVLSGLEEAVSRAIQREPIALVGRRGKTQAMFELAKGLENPIVVRVPAAPDQVPYVLLQIAAGCGKSSLRLVAAALARSADEPEEALRILDGCVGKRPLLVDDVDAIGTRGIDPELQKIFRSASAQVRKWIRARALIVTQTTSSHASRALRVEPKPAPRATSHQAIWEGVAHDVDLFGLALLRDKLASDVDADVDEQVWEPSEIISDVWFALPDPMREVVAILAAHGRPIARDVLDSLELVDPAVLHESIQTSVVEHRSGLVWLPKPWYAHCPALLSSMRARALHLNIGQALARQLLDGDARENRPELVLEAHRHFAAAPDIERARDFAMFGASMLLETARRQSLAAKANRELYAPAAHTYDVILSIHEALQRKHGGCLGARTVAYATHYKHYNRYHAGAELLAETLRGYDTALQLWPQNALFHSRTIVGLFIDGRYGDARRQLESAYDHVPQHSQRDRYLRARTTEKLLERGYIEPALLAWGDHQAGEFEHATAQKLQGKVEAGFSQARLRGWRATLDLVQPTLVKFASLPTHWLARALDVSGSGASPAEAYESLIANLRAEAQRLHRSLTHTLSAEDRFRKQTLLGTIDLAASRLLEGVDSTTWIFGRLTKDGDQLVLRTDEGESFALELPDVDGLATESAYRLAKVRAGAAGEPIGPVIELDRPLGSDPARVWEQWKKLLAGGDE